jgi:segregation and condensation protein B
VERLGGCRHRTREKYAAAIRAAGRAQMTPDLSKWETLVLAAVAYVQPVTRTDLGEIFGREVSRDIIEALRAEGLIVAGPRPGAPYTYVTTRAFLERYGFGSLADLPDMEALEDAGRLGAANRLDGLAADLVASEEDPEDAETPGTKAAGEASAAE